MSTQTANLKLTQPQVSDTISSTIPALSSNAGTIDSEFALSGTTANRPTSNNYVGRQYFDTTLGAMVTWNGSAWVQHLTTAQEGAANGVATLDANSRVVQGLSGNNGREVVYGVDGGNNLWFTTGQGSEPNNLAIGWTTNGVGVVTAINLGTGGGHPTVYVPGYLSVGNVSSLPTASSSYRGQIIYVQGNGTTTADVAYMCLMSSTGTYSWKQVVSG